MKLRNAIWIFLILPLMFSLGSCSRSQRRIMEVTAYCPCGKCNGYTRGRWLYLKVNFWNKYVNHGPNKGKPYTGKTASGAKPRPYDPGILSFRNVTRPWMIPIRVLSFPWMILPQKGTIAADTRYYPFGTKMYVPGYGWGIVEDRGGAIKGPNIIDIHMSSHSRAMRWGRKKVEVEIYPKK